MPVRPSDAIFGDLDVDEPSPGFDEDDLAFVTGHHAPEGSTEPPEDLAVELFDSGWDISSASNPAEAAEAALALLLRFIPAESAAVLVASLNDTALRFLAVTGPSAEDVRHLTVPFHKGFAGFSHTMGADLVVRDVAKDSRLFGEVDAQSGYETRSVLAVALKDNDGDVHGCIELLNPTGGFHTWHIETSRSVALTLANYLGTRM